MNKKIVLLLMLIILVIAGVLRFWQLGKVPISPDWDEPALGYNAYSIIQTGRDEYGKFLPVVLRSFDDYKPAFYAYLAIPEIILFGLSVYAVRFPSALLGVLTVLATFFLAREIFRNSKFKDQLSLLSAFFLAISPWHLQFSRIAFESNIGLALNVFSALSFIKGLRKPFFLYLSGIFACLSIYTYQSEKVFTPLLLLLLIVVFRKELLKVSKKHLICSILLAVIVIFPMVLYLFQNKDALLRVQGTSIFSNKTELLQEDIDKLNYDNKANNKIGLILDNRRVIYAKAIIGGYLSHFNLNWLFITGDLARHHAPDMGILYLWDLPFLLFGIYFLLFGDYDRKAKLIIFGWFLIAPIPASVTSGVPHAVRTLNFLPTFQILIAVGFINSFLFLKRFTAGDFKRKVIRYFVYLAVVLFGVFNFSYYLNQYFVQQNYFNASFWQYGWEPTVDYVKIVEANYSKIIVSDAEPLDRSYMFFAFYLNYPPQDYQFYNRTTGGFKEHHSFGKYEFRPIDWEKDSQGKNVLLIGSPNEFPPSVKPKKLISFPDGKPDIEIVDR